MPKVAGDAGDGHIQRALRVVCKAQSANVHKSVDQHPVAAVAQERRQAGDRVVEQAGNKADLVALAPRRVRVQRDAAVRQLVQVQSALVQLPLQRHHHFRLKLRRRLVQPSAPHGSVFAHRHVQHSDSLLLDTRSKNRNELEVAPPHAFDRALCRGSRLDLLPVPRCDDLREELFSVCASMRRRS